MLDAFIAGVEYYQPTAGGHDLEHEEAGVTECTTENLRDLFAMAPERPERIEIGPNGGVLICWPTLETYLATGFGVGYAGEGSEGLVRFLVEHGFGSEEDMRRIVRGVGQDFRGVLIVKGTVIDDQPPLQD